jgi:hypothetical protein
VVARQRRQQLLIRRTFQRLHDNQLGNILHAVEISRRGAGALREKKRELGLKELKKTKNSRQT